MRCFMVSVLLVLGPVASVVAEDWPTWRGPDGNGVSSESGLPVSWSEDENVAWKARLGGLGLSTPIVLGDRIFVTSQTGRGEVREGNHPTLGGGDGAPEELSLGGSAEDVVFLVEGRTIKHGAQMDDEPEDDVS